MQRLAPDPLPLPTRHRRPNPNFARGELPRLAMAVMREEGAPLPVSVIARRCLAAKGVDRPGPGTMKTTKSRLHDMLLKWDARGLTMRVGTGRETRRGLA